MTGIEALIRLPWAVESVFAREEDLAEARAQLARMADADVTHRRTAACHVTRAESALAAARSDAQRFAQLATPVALDADTERAVTRLVDRGKRSRHHGARGRGLDA